MIFYINIENDNGKPKIRGGEFRTKGEAIEAAKHKIFWEHGSYLPTWFAIAVPVGFTQSICGDGSRTEF